MMQGFEWSHLKNLAISFTAVYLEGVTQMPNNMQS